ncbi:DUF3301 domain-containing protein [Oleiagrimonas sp. C23AA]|uniref:DUF3301 domain-containing protein n=1 Tax=Oleiagrimonas sp. C23AA TaxID=2719047 RepID=UPI001423CC8B|nr:DUF3301 domain-containing protein [Oleiagrimonas sp. C23AA]
MTGEWTFLLIVVVLGLTWLEHMRVRDVALAEARRLCQSQQVQLLDETIGLSALRLRRHDGRLRVEKRYGFDVSLDGQDRRHGHLWLAGRRVIGISTPWHGDGATVIDFPGTAMAPRQPRPEIVIEPGQTRPPAPAEPADNSSSPRRPT